MGIGAFDGVELAAGDEKHLSGGDGELDVLVAAGKDRHEGGALGAVGQLVGVGVPVGLAETAGLDDQLVEGKPFQKREVGFGGGGATAAGVGNLRLNGMEGKVVFNSS